MIVFIAFSLWLDALWLYRTVPPWLTVTKGANLALDVSMRRVKPLKVWLFRPDTVLVGSSVVYRGLDPLDVNGIDVYNLGLSSLMSDELPLLANVLQDSEAQTIILGLDYYMFTALKGPPRLDQHLNTTYGRLRSATKLFIGLDAMSALFKTWTGRVEPGIWRANGYKETPDFSPAVTRQVDAAQTFDQTPYRPETLRYVRAFLNTLKDRNVIVYLSPITQAQKRRFEQASELESLSRWRMEMHALVQEEQRIFYDFTDDHILDDFDPEKGSSTHWIDNLHFKPVVGRSILQRMTMARKSHL